MSTGSIHNMYSLHARSVASAAAQRQQVRHAYEHATELVRTWDACHDELKRVSIFGRASAIFALRSRAGTRALATPHPAALLPNLVVGAGAYSALLLPMLK